MDDAAIGRSLYVIRRRLRLRQADVAGRSGLSQDAVSRIERGMVSTMTVRSARRVFEAIGASLNVEVRHRGAQLDNLRDQTHAQVARTFARLIALRGWQVLPEFTYSEYGERGSIDLLGIQPAYRAVLVAEVKSQIVSIEATLRKLDEKARLVPRLVRRKIGWEPRTVKRILVVLDTSTNRRRIAGHAAMFNAALPSRASMLREWLRDPITRVDGVWFLSPTDEVRARRRFVGRDGTSRA